MHITVRERKMYRHRKKYHQGPKKEKKGAKQRYRNPDRGNNVDYMRLQFGLCMDQISDIICTI